MAFSLAVAALWAGQPALAQPACVVPDNGGGTVNLPPQGCGYVSPADLHEIINGLPPGTTINVGAEHSRFFNVTSNPGGSLGGEKETFDSFLTLTLQGTGGLAGYNRVVMMQAAAETHIGPRTPGAPVQSFDTDMFRLQGQLPPGDPDFDLLRITAGTSFGMPSPGHTTLTTRPGGNWNVDSFFDITYRIDFVGHPGGPLGGMSGSTTATIRMNSGHPVPPPPPPCFVPDNGSGTVNLPPQGCGYVSPSDLHEIINGLPPGTTINVGAEHQDFFNVTGGPGGSLGGEVENFNSFLRLDMQGTGGLGGFHRVLSLQATCETHIGPRTPGAPVQSFDTDMFRLQGQLPPGDPDFDLLRITAGTGFGMPSPGHTTLTRQSGGNWAVDSFFDITYRIDFVGRPGGSLGGMSGSTTGTIRMSTGTSSCVPADCSDGNPCTQDQCNQATGQCEHLPVDCNDNNPCTADSCNPMACVIADNGSGTVTLPPQGCGYVSPSDVHEIIDGLPAGTTIQLAAVHKDFVCPAGGGSGVCSFAPPAPGVDCDQPGGSLGGEQECANSTLALTLTGTGGLSGYQRTLDLPLSFETHTAPRTPGAPVQSFDTDMFRLFGQITNPGSGDPDFDLLRIVAGTDFGLPSPGHTTLTQQPGGNWAVDSFFDITYRIDFVGRPGGPLSGMSGSTTGTIRMSSGGGGGCVNSPVDCDDQNPCTVDSCNPATGQCEHSAVNCDDQNPCTADSCSPATGQCVHTPVDCDDNNACTVDSCQPGCVVADSGGTASLPPQGCGYVSPADVHKIIDGLPPGTTIEVGAQHAGFLNITTAPGGSLGGEAEQFDSSLSLRLTGTGGLAGFMRTMNIAVACETHVGPRVPGTPVQSFDTDMFRLQGQLPPGDPDFDLLRITGGTAFGLPSPGHTTLTQQPGGGWAVDSFFDITYRIDFVGHPGGPLGGMSGSTTGTIRMATGGGTCVHTPLNCNDNNPCTVDTCNPASGCVSTPVDCDDQNPCTLDSCNPATGQCDHVPTNCDDQNPCTVDSCVPAGGAACSVTDNGGGTATLPPHGCDYLSPSDVHEIIDGLPPGTTIQVAAVHKDFVCSSGANPVCSFPAPVPGVDCDQPGGTLGGEEECATSTLSLTLTGTGGLAGYQRTLDLPIAFETHTAPRTPGSPVQSFDTVMFRLFGQITNPGSGDPDFDLLRIVAGTDFGMPSPGHTTLTQQATGWDVDSFFDITYRIDFVGRPGGALSGMSGSTTGTIRMGTGGGQCVHTPVDCEDNNPCTADSCNPATGQCEHAPVSCDDLNPCTVDTCVPTTSSCLAPDNGSGTVTLPAQGPECGYLSPADVHEIIDGLPAGTTIQLAAVHRDFICPPAGGSSVCSFSPPAPGVDCDQPGGSLGGDQECAGSNLAMHLTGTGGLAGYNRTLILPIGFETHTAPHTPGAPVQSFDTDMFRLFGQITNPGSGDPDFDLLRIVGGTDFGLPSPGHTTLTLQPGGNWAVDSFFDITYRIDFVGRPGGPLSGMSGSTTGTIRMSTGSSPGPGCTHTPVNCDDNNACTADSCNPATGLCQHAPIPVTEPNSLTGAQPVPTVARFNWPTTPDATHYNNYRGKIPPTLLGSRPAASRYDHTCFESADAFGDGPTTTVDPGIPAVGTAYYYFESGENACGESDLGHASSGATVPNTSPCPTPP